MSQFFSNFATKFNIKIMRSYILSIFALLFFTLSAHAAQVSVSFVDGTTTSSVLISYDEKLLVVESNTFIKYAKKYHPDEVVSFIVEDVGRFFSKDGKFVFDDSYEVVKQAETSEEQVSSPIVQKTGPATPNEVIGKAFKVTGTTALSIGVPALAAGAILTAIGHTDSKSVDETVTKSKCAEAGYFLLPAGAALTIVGIPLVVHGKRIMEMNINYTGNGAGVTVNF